VPTLREIATYMRGWLPLVEARIRKDDERELAEARARVSEIEARIGLAKPVLLGAAAVPTDVAIRATAMKGKPAEWAETDAGMGVGRQESEPAFGSADAFNAELASLREQNMAKRRRRALA
jgi:hypothetical protein